MDTIIGALRVHVPLRALKIIGMSHFLCFRILLARRRNNARSAAVPSGRLVKLVRKRTNERAEC